MGQGGFTNAWNIFNQQMTASQHTRYAVLELLFFANNHRVKLIQKRPDWVRIHVQNLSENKEVRGLSKWEKQAISLTVHVGNMRWALGTLSARNA